MVHGSPSRPIADSDGARAETPGPAARPFSPQQRTQILVVRADGSGLRQSRQASALLAAPPGQRTAANRLLRGGAADWRAMSRDFMARPGTSQIVSVVVATGARRELTTGPGRKFLPRWLGANRIAYLFGDADPVPGTRERVIPAAARHRLYRWRDFADWSLYQRELVERRQADRVSSHARRCMAARGDGPESRCHILDRSHRHLSVVHARRSPARIEHGVCGPISQQHHGDVAGRRRSPARLRPPEAERRRAGMVARRRPHRVWAGRYNEGRESALCSHVAVINADGSGLRLLTERTPGNHGFPSWSPDGRKIVYRSTNGEAKGLVIIDAASGVTTALPSGAWNDKFPAWSPRGDRILFTSDRDGDWELYTIRPDGSDLKRLTRSPGNDAHATWSFDGEWIAFASARGGFKDEMPVGEGGGQGAGDIFVMRADGSDVRRLTDDAFEEATPTFAPSRSLTTR